MSESRISWRHGDRLAFRCPGCDTVHEAVVSGPKAWQWNESSDVPTLRPSVLVHGHIRGVAGVCHSFVTEGVIEFLGDCTHALAGQKVPLPAFENPYAEWPQEGG